MARFDYYAGSRGKGYLLDCQSDFLDEFETRVVVPLLPTTGLVSASRLNPVFEISGDLHIMSTQLIFAMPVERLGAKKGSLRQEHYTIMTALDMLLTDY
ncbi:MAG: CcdB family protein [Sphingorhabdus sp.]